MREVQTLEEFRTQVLESKEPVIALFWATWCPFCRRFKPDFDRIAEGKPWQFVSVHLEDESNPLWDDYSVEVIPTMALFQGGALVDREDGVLGYGIDRTMTEAFVRRVSGRLQ